MPNIARPISLAIVALLLLAPPGLAGAWPRGTGHSFTATTTRLTDGSIPLAPRVLTSVFHESGLSNRMTLGFELDLAAGRLNKAMAFYQISLLPPQHRSRLTFALGGGTLSGDPAISPRIMLGHGFELFQMHGWVEANIGAEVNLATKGLAGKIDLTLGLSAGPRVKSYVQVFAYQARGGQPYLRLESSTALRIFKHSWIDLGLSTGITPIVDRQIKIGIWTSF
ncbi:hypothetical protein [Pseudooceanicola sp.]|uniref:hypothetical protein n=1 Tax=Pseudooceanicola sp. TaxID=1914328 RepID=UPI00262A1180|nr:hypothetical protein [Pseudooceanicola sp.]MDF1854554.1 hypothetical protein [Pseudooceanicola sp.]